MALLNIRFGRADDTGAIQSVPFKSENVTTGAASAQSSNSAGNDGYCIITCQAGNAYVKFGANPTAAAGSDHLLIAGATYIFRDVEPGFKVAHINGP